MRNNDRDDRVRAALGLEQGDPLPLVDQATLLSYMQYLSENLVLPFTIWQSAERQQQLTVTGLTLTEGEERDGLRCCVIENGAEIEMPLAEVEVASGGRTKELIEDYGYWFWSHHADAGQKVQPVSLPSLLGTLVQAALATAVAFGAVGAVWNTYDEADTAIRTGACVLGIVGGWKGLGWSWANAILGVAFGAVLGGVLAAMLTAWAGAFLGGLTGFLLGVVLFLLFKSVLVPLLALIGGSFVGIGFEAWQHNYETAQVGIWAGGLIGAITGPLAIIGLGMVLSISLRQRH